MAFVDGGATTSFINSDWVADKKIPIRPRTGKIQQFLSSHDMPRIGIVENLLLENGIYKIRVDLEVAPLSGKDQMVIGIDLFEPLGYELTGYQLIGQYHTRW